MEEDTVPEVFQPQLRTVPEMLATFFFQQKIVDTRSDTKKDNTYDFKKIVDKRRDTKKDKTRKQKRLKPSISTP